MSGGFLGDYRPGAVIRVDSDSAGNHPGGLYGGLAQASFASQFGQQMANQNALHSWYQGRTHAVLIDPSKLKPKSGRFADELQDEITAWLA